MKFFNYCFCAFILSISLNIASAQADLTSTTLNSLLADSEVIVDGTVSSVSGSKEPGQAKQSVFTITKVLHGKAETGDITISWGTEIHDQKLDEGQRYVLFLTRHEGKFIGAQYGRSYWPIVENDSEDCPATTPFSYPFDIVNISEEYLIKNDGQGIRICVSKILPGLIPSSEE